MSPKTDTEVLIGGKVFTLSGYESEDYMQKIASYINNKMTEYGKLDSFRRQSLDRQSVLLQRDIADDYFKAKKQISILEEELQGKEKELYDLKHELISLRMQIEEAQKNEQEALDEKNLLEGKVKELEKELDKQIRQMESTHPGYDEYRYQLDEIGHDPYQLISHLTAVYEQFTRGQVKPVIKELFKQQYLLKVWETIEIRTRMETRVGIRPTIDAFGNVSMETYTYQEEVEYEYKILNVLLKNKGFDTIARKNMNRKQTGRYDAYNLTYGNRPELFGAGSPTYSFGTTGSIGTGGGAGGSGGGFKYDIPSEALSDEKFAKMIKEAEKYLGMPYVWGGSSPSTSFDCSGFVSYVFTNSGVYNTGRLGATGLYGICQKITADEARPGDLIFFEKTYNTVGASHVGIYVGNGMMIHCGDPISYTSINSTYWQSHFLGFGRIN